MTSATSLMILCTTASAVPSDGMHVLVHPDGKMQLQCKTRWHKLDLTLKVSKSQPLREANFQGLRPPKLREGTTWQVKGATIHTLGQAIHALKWQSSEANRSAYLRWQGDSPTRRSLKSTGQLDLKLMRTREGYQAHFRGGMESLDEGWLANRFGPNGWRHRGKHRLSGTVFLNQEGQILKCEVKDTFQIKGLFHSGTSKDPFTQKGTVKLTIQPPKPLSGSEFTKAKQWIRALGSDDFAKRERASNALRKMGPGVASLLRELGLTSKDPEVRRRTRRILERLP